MRLFLSLVLWLLTPVVLAQLVPAKRVEYAVDEDDDDEYQVLPLGEQGALLTYYQHKEYRRDQHHYTFTRIDTSLAVRWKAEYTLPDRFAPAHQFENDRFRFYLAGEPDTDRFHLTRLNLDDGTLDTYTWKLPSPLTLVDFKVMGNVGYLAGYHHARPVVMAYSLFDGTVKIFQGLYVNNLEINSLEVDEPRQEIHVLTHTVRRTCSFALRSYTPDGRPLRVIDYGSSPYTLVSGRLLPVGHAESLLMGTYATDCTPYAQGIYFTRIHHRETGRQTVPMQQRDTVQYVDFARLTHFFDYLKPKRQQRIQARLANQQRQGKESRLRYRVLVHQLLPTVGGVRLVGEVLFPQYRGAISTYSARAWRAATNPASRFRPAPILAGNSTLHSDGYRVSHAFVCEFDREGNLLWDNCLPVDDLTDENPVEKIQVLDRGNQLLLAYAQEDELTTATLTRDSVRVDEVVKVTSGSEREKVQVSADEQITAWYGPYFLATGYQKLGPERGFTGENRELFYLSKMAYNPAPRTAPTAPAKPANGPATPPDR